MNDPNSVRLRSVPKRNVAKNGGAAFFDYALEANAQTRIISMNMKRKIPLTLAALSIAMACTSATAGQESTTAVANQVSTKAPIDPSALLRAQQKLALAEQVAQQFTIQAANEGLPESWHTDLLSAMMRMPEAEFGPIQAATSATQAVNLARSAASSEKRRAQIAAQLGQSQADSSQAKALGSSTIDLTFIPLPVPCRIVDTRASGAGGALSAGQTRVFSFDILSTQGSSSCTPFTGYIGDGEGAAVAVNITVVSSASAVPGSFLKAFPDGGSSPTSWLNFGPSQTIANAGILGLSSSGNFDITVNSSTNVIVDAFGTFIRPEATALDCLDTTKVTANLPASGNVTVIAAACPAGYTVTGGSCFGGGTESRALQESVLNANNQWFCRWQDYGGTAVQVAAQNHCCRVPGR